MSKVWWRVALGLWLMLIWYLSSIPDLSSGLRHDFLLRKIGHVILFAILTALALGSFKKPQFRWRHVYIALALSAAYAGIDEWHQTFVSGRGGTVHDVAIDGVGIVLVVLLYTYCARLETATT